MGQCTASCTSCTPRLTQGRAVFPSPVFTPCVTFSPSPPVQEEEAERAKKAAADAAAAVAREAAVKSKLDAKKVAEEHAKKLDFLTRAVREEESKKLEVVRAALREHVGAFTPVSLAHPRCEHIHAVCV